MPHHRCGKRTHAFVTDAQSAAVLAFSWAQEVLFWYQGSSVAHARSEKAPHVVVRPVPSGDLQVECTSVVELCCAMASQEMVDWPREKGSSIHVDQLCFKFSLLGASL